MTHKTESIEINDREKLALQNVKLYSININVGGGIRHKHEVDGSTSKADLVTLAEDMAFEVFRPSMIYATGLIGDMEVPVLVATFKPRGKSGTWKTVEAFA